MFELIWDLAVGPKWARVIQMLILVAAAVSMLLWAVYPALYDARAASIAV